MPKQTNDFKARKGFTLIEVLAAATIMVIILGAVLLAVSDVLRSWNESAGKIEGFYEGDSLADFIQQDMQSMIIRRDGKAWLQVSYPNNVGMLTGARLGGIPLRPPQIMFFSPTYVRPRFDAEQLMTKSTQRTPIAGSICAVKYQMSYKSPFRTGSANEGTNSRQPNAFYGLYRAVIDSRSTFEEALGEAQGNMNTVENALQRFWNGTCSVLSDDGYYTKGIDLKSWVLSPENFIASNIVDFQVTFAVMYPKEGEVRQYESPYEIAYIEPGTPFTVADKLYIDGKLYQRTSGGGKSYIMPNEVENGFLAFAEVSMTFISDIGAQEIRNLSGENKQQRFKELRMKYGTTTTRKISFMVQPAE